MVYSSLWGVNKLLLSISLHILPEFLLLLFLLVQENHTVFDGGAPGAMLQGMLPPGSKQITLLEIFRDNVISATLCFNSSVAPLVPSDLVHLRPLDVQMSYCAPRIL